MAMSLTSYEEICADHRWQVPAQYNIAADVCDKHARDKPAMIWESFETMPLSALPALFAGMHDCSRSTASFRVPRARAIRAQNPLATLDAHHT